mmetsp:Transcript_82648/g.172998  ORF Transcript_82648/g.172998 Transcript_82648/m.172998 type:complete len:379 (-) Transcript_82648:390-1526(-)|eukprot:CAMPEP_0206484016 /NCGR_PEP_ID=MMETSP0324_2-20121206/39747_1 /ASSEMBLY_ACC=CAM_ASM_000836 /TAXON_ID=2866 /ORGANISM="Crypthecodinium cohnii, Strain Seligo" /LENGTH=378 /DNA_ID=CAMNT_0053962131 /DNA_START=32 /DNA_END=1168 /DNA_ORIENTATION=+
MRAAAVAIVAVAAAAISGASASNAAIATPTTMKAVVATGRGSDGDFSKIKVVVNHPVPQPGPGQVLIRVAASSVNPIDWKLYVGEEMTNLTSKHPKVLGFDVSGKIEALGKGCKRLQVGDEVWADLGIGKIGGEMDPSDALQLGAWAEFAVAEESQVGLKPKKLSFDAAATLPLVGLTDLQAFKKVGLSKMKNYSTAVVTSGAGGTGVVALQLLKAFGFERIVTASSPSHYQVLKNLGATYVVDYHKGSIWAYLDKDTMDLVYDNYGAPGTADLAMKVLRSGGTFIFLPGKGETISKQPKAGVQQINFGLCDSSDRKGLDALAKLAQADSLKAVVEQSFVLEDIVSALKLSLSGHMIGKIGIKVANLSSSDDEFSLVV